jgi:hypothetical protein
MGKETQHLHYTITIVLTLHPHLHGPNKRIFYETNLHRYSRQPNILNQLHQYTITKVTTLCLPNFN